MKRKKINFINWKISTFDKNNSNKIYDILEIKGKPSDILTADNDDPKKGTFIVGGILLAPILDFRYLPMYDNTYIKNFKITVEIKTIDQKYGINTLIIPRNLYYHIILKKLIIIHGNLLIKNQNIEVNIIILYIMIIYLDYILILILI